LSDLYSSNTFNSNKKGSLARAILGYYNYFMGESTVADVEAQCSDKDHSKIVIFITALNRREPLFNWTTAYKES
jgi:hypothetical protein